MDEQEARALVVAEARSWLLTPFHHQAHIKGLGVDCAWLLIMCFRAAGIVAADFRPGNYSREWFLHHDEERYMGIVAQYAHQLSEGAAPKPADIALYKIGRCVSHGSIYIGEGLMIHANRKAKQVELAEVKRCEMTRYFHSWWSAFQ
jgi:cell wall-associated NlpC family hydrolase